MDISRGTELVKIARKAIEEYLEQGKTRKPKAENRYGKSGVFVTLKTYPGGELRGCIGYAEPAELLPALVDSAISAATRDPRFPPVEKEELDNLLVEVTVLSRPELMKVSSPSGYLERIKIGRDGLIVEKGYCKGLLLPIVPVEYSWVPLEFLCHTCLKAGLESDAWQDKETKVYCFKGELFSEEKPKGKIVKVVSSTARQDTAASSQQHQL